MADPSTWTDPSTLIGGGGALAGIGAVIKTVLDWRKDRQQQALSDRQQRVTSEDLIRDDLIGQLNAQRSEIQQLRQELGDARRELRAFQDLHMAAMADWQQRYGELFTEFASLKAMVQARTSSSEHTF